MPLLVYSLLLKVYSKLRSLKDKHFLTFNFISINFKTDYKLYTINPIMANANANAKAKANIVN